MSDGPRLGQLIEDGDKRRDCCHVAVAPVTAAVRLMPGQHVGLVPPLYPSDAGLVEPSGNNIGIVDPFLPGPVEEGQRFWLFMYPNSITGLRYVWTHHAFQAANSSPTSKNSRSTSAVRAGSLAGDFT